MMSDVPEPPRLLPAALEHVLSFLTYQACAVRAASPRARICLERQEPNGAASGGHGVVIERVPAYQARERGVCLAPPPAGVKEVLVVTYRARGEPSSARAALEVSMWWVDRCLGRRADEATATTTTTSPLQCCVRVMEVAVERLGLYSSEDSPASSNSAVVRLRMPRHPFALQLCRLAELRYVQLSPSMRRLVVELDMRSCLRWSHQDVSALLASLQSPLCAVRAGTCAISPLRLMNRFHASLRVLYLFRRAATFRDPRSAAPPPAYEDEEYEEEESNPSPLLAPARTPGMGLLPPAVGSAARRRRTTRLRLSAAAAAAPVLEELHVSNSSTRCLPKWVEVCTALRHVTLRSCSYLRVDSLRTARRLVSISLDGCSQFSGYDVFCSFPELRSVSVKNCSGLRDLSWLPRLTSALRSLTIHHPFPAPLTTFASAAFLGVGLSGLEELHLAVPSLHALRPFISHAASTLRELALTNCANLNGFADLPALPVLMKVTITANRHMQNFLWLAKSPQLVEVRATQCPQLTSLTGLDALRQLRVLDVGGCAQIRTIAPLAECVSLTHLDVSQCGLLTRMSVLEHLPRLRWVVLRNCTSLSKDFTWIHVCRELEELVVPGTPWLESAARVLRHLERRGVMLR